MERMGPCFLSMYSPMFLGLLGDVAFVTGKVYKEKPKGQQGMVGRSHARAAQAWDEEAAHRMGSGASEHPAWCLR